MADGVEISRDGATTILRLARPEKKNALTAVMYEALGAALEEASGDETVAAVVLLGSPGIFSAGNDIGDFVRSAAAGHGIGPSILPFLRALATADRPLIAGVDGPAVGIGTTLLLHCDVVLASPQAVFRTPFLDLGLVPEAGSSLLAPRLIGHGRAFALLVLGRDFDSERAMAAGLVTEIVAAAELEERALAVARELAAKPRQALLASRRLLRGDSVEVLERIETEAEIFAERLASPEAQAAFTRFIEKGRS